ncbi:hypothetical protein [Haloferula sp.]|uniref:BatD family protein n=1 Tax=Haloferula sp. TaxID=2497595 RepID=UPI003C778A7A
MKKFLQKETKITKERHGLLRLIELTYNLFKNSLSSFPSVQILFILTAVLTADPGAKLIIPEPEAWTGQRVPLFIELRAEGSFKGAASFDLPEIPKTVIIKIGSPVLSSETDGDREYFVQRHEFALFSQADGTLELPPITARFSHLKGYTGPTFDTEADTEPATLTINRPPGSESLGFLVTTPSLEVEESWDPTPGPLETGAVLKRTIEQRAEQMTGIALEPAPTPEIDGIRTYLGSPEVKDETERGEFLGERRDTLTYLIQQAGLHTLPEIRYRWWNPTTQTLELRTLPAVSFTATAPPLPPEKPSPTRYLWLLVPAALLTCGFIFRLRLATAFHQLYEWIDPPPRRAERAFLRACHRNDPKEAMNKWNKLRPLLPELTPSEMLSKELSNLYAQLYGVAKNHQTWSGDALATALKLTKRPHREKVQEKYLPRLNP